MAFVERANCQLSARDGVIAILCKTTKELRLHKYLDKLNLINKQLFGENYFCGDEGKKKKNSKGRIEEIGEEEEDEIIREPIPLMRA